MCAGLLPKFKWKIVGIAIWSTSGRPIRESHIGILEITKELVKVVLGVT